MKDAMLCAQCRIGDHRNHNEDGCSNDNNFNSDCACPVEYSSWKAFMEQFAATPETPSDAAMRAADAHAPLRAAVEISEMYRAVQDGWRKTPTYHEVRDVIVKHAAIWCEACKAYHSTPRDSADRVALGCKGVWFFADSAAAPSNEIATTAAVKILEWLNFDTSLDVVQEDVAGVAAIITHHLPRSVVDFKAWTSIDQWLRDNPQATANECLAELVKRIKADAAATTSPEILPPTEAAKAAESAAHEVCALYGLGSEMRTVRGIILRSFVSPPVATTGDDEGDAALRERLAQLQKWQYDVEEREAAVCPEDVPFDEYIRHLESKLKERQANA